MGKLLDTIHSPADIKSFTVPELEALAQEIREQLILVLSKTGGHLGPNLGRRRTDAGYALRLQHSYGQVCL